MPMDENNFMLTLGLLSHSSLTFFFALLAFLLKNIGFTKRLKGNKIGEFHLLCFCGPSPTFKKSHSFIKTLMILLEKYA